MVGAIGAIFCCPRRRNPNFCPIGIAELRRHDADHGVILAIEAVGPADDVGVTAKTVQPYGIAENDLAIAAGLHLVRGKSSAQQRSDFQHVKEVMAHLGSGEALRVVAAREGEAMEVK